MTDTERGAMWAASAGIYRGYEKYQERVQDRTIRSFVLVRSTRS